LGDARSIMVMLKDKGSEALEELMKSAELLAQTEMRTQGKVHPTLLMNGADGIGMLQPKQLASEREKDHFLQVGRLTCIAHGAIATVLVTESWMVTPKRGEQLDLSVPPSKSPNRQEVVTIMGETRQGHAQKILPIVRSEQGEFIGFSMGNPDMEAKDVNVKGRFSQFLSITEPDDEARELAKEVLRRIGLSRQKKQEERKDRGMGRGLY
jgi:hypothetical protein